VAYREGHQAQDRSRRAWQLTALLVLAAFILACRLFQLQVLGVREYTLQSQRNRIRVERFAAPRGLILDHRGAVLADSRPSYTVRAEPRRLLSDERELEALAKLLAIPREDVVSRLRKGSAHIPVVVVRDASFVQVSRVAEREEDLPGVSLDVATVRWYPNGVTAGHVLGHVGEISEHEVESLKDRGYRAGDFLGRTGLEKAYESELRGQDGERWLEVDAIGRVVGRFAADETVPAKPGRTLHLYLDLGLQAIADSCLAGRRGSVCMVDVRTGGVRVLESAPAFDSNLFAPGIRSADWRRLNEDPERPLLFRAVQATYAPGSTFKMVTFAAALDERIVGFHQRLPVGCYGGYRFGNRYFRCWEEKGHGSLALEDALVFSCDTYFYQIGERVNVDAIANRAKAAGFGRKTGIDLPQELTGNVPDSAWLNKRWGERGWTQGTVLNHAIGQGEYLVTPLQMADYAAMLARGGISIAPRLVEAVEDEEGTMVVFPPDTTGTWPVQPETIARIREAMHQVVERGTGAVCRIPEYMPAGKTGTAENPHGQAHSWFMGFAPFDQPEVAFAVIVEAGGHGSDVAAPIAKRLLLEIVARRTPPKEAG
jgi:penicillin-binding protein 2